MLLYMIVMSHKNICIIRIGYSCKTQSDWEICDIADRIGPSILEELQS
jgi:hypothetical protein